VLSEGVQSSKDVLVGTDKFGNSYYNVTIVQNGREVTRRQCKPKDYQGQELAHLTYEPNIPAEWESWLRKRRRDPPTEEELEASQRYREMVQQRAANLAAKDAKMREEEQRMGLTRGLDASQPMNPAQMVFDQARLAAAAAAVEGGTNASTPSTIGGEAPMLAQEADASSAPRPRPGLGVDHANAPRFGTDVGKTEEITRQGDHFVPAAWDPTAATPPNKS